MDNINKLQNNALESNKVGRGQEPIAVQKFGFPVATCCGFIPQNNEWLDDWVVSVFPTQVVFFCHFNEFCRFNATDISGWRICGICTSTCRYQVCSQCKDRELSNGFFCHLKFNFSLKGRPTQRAQTIEINKHPHSISFGCPLNLAAELVGCDIN